MTVLRRKKCKSKTDSMNEACCPIKKNDSTNQGHSLKAKESSENTLGYGNNDGQTHQNTKTGYDKQD